MLLIMDRIHSCFVPIGQPLASLWASQGLDHVQSQRGAPFLATISRCQWILVG